MKNLQVLDIIKSFFCFKDKKTKLINLCDDVINRDLCIEKILERLYTLENFCNIFVEEDKAKLGNDEDIYQIKNLINCLDKELNKEEKKEEITSKEK